MRVTRKQNRSAKRRQTRIVSEEERLRRGYKLKKIIV